jgi:hypothetical protein
MRADISAIKNKINRRSPFNLGGILSLIASVYLICHILICDDVMPISIGSMSSYFNHLASHWHFLAVALLPIYVGLMIFGTAILGAYIGSALHYWAVKLIQKHRGSGHS